MKLKNIRVTFILIVFSACQSTSQTEPSHKPDDTAAKHTSANAATEKQPPAQLSAITVGEMVTGDFNGDGVPDTASIHIVKEGKFDEEPFLLAIQFSSKIIAPLEGKYDHADLVLVNEGDLDGQPGDELSVFAAPNHGCTYTMYTYTCKTNRWRLLLEPFLVATACDPISAEDLQQRILREGTHVYFLDADPNDETGKLFRVKAEIATQ